MKREQEATYIYIYIYIYTCLVPRDCSRIDLCYFTSYKSYFSSLLLLFFFILLTYSLSANFSTPFPENRIIAKTFPNLRVSMTSYGKFFKEFFQMRHFQVVKKTYCLGFSTFLICKQFPLNFFSWPSLAKSENVFQPLSKPRHIEHNKENKLPCVIHVSVCLIKRFHDSVGPLCNTVDHRCRQVIVKTKQWHTSRECVTHIFFPTHVMTSSVIY